MKFLKIIQLFIIFFLFACKGQNEEKGLVKGLSFESQIPKELKIISEENINIDTDSSLEKIITAKDSLKEITKEFWYKKGKIVYEFEYPSTSINKKWLINLDNDDKKEIIRAQGDEDGVDYAIFGIQDRKQIPILYFNSIIQDKKNTDKFFWGYPWDMDGLIINEKKQILVSLNNSYERDGEFIKPDSQSELPFVLFYGKTTQPDIFISSLNKPKYYSLQELLNILAQKNQVNTNKFIDWDGEYEGTFLRLKDESADPRAWGQIKVEIKNKEASLYLDTYVEIIKKKLTIYEITSNELKLKDNLENKFLTIKKVEGKYYLEGNIIESIVGIKEKYEIKKIKD